MRPLVGKFLPQELIGRTVYDAYESPNGLFIEFDCGTIICYGSNRVFDPASACGRSPNPTSAAYKHNPADYKTTKRSRKKSV